MYASSYPELQDNKDKILKLFIKEEEIFQKTLNKGLQEINNLISSNKSITPKE